MIPEKMAALIHVGAPGIAGLSLEQMPVPQPGPGDVLIAVEYAGLNRHELFTAIRRTGTEPARILGADAVGTVVAHGEGTTTPGLGERVLLNPTLHWERVVDVPEHPVILGGPCDGTFAEYVSVPAVNVHPVPGHLTPAEAGSLGLAAVTAFRALVTVGELVAGEHVLIPGIGGGVALLAMDLALALGAEVTVTSRSAEKCEVALHRGAAYALASGAELTSLLHRPVDLAIDSIGAASVPTALSALRPGGRLVTFGATTGAEVPISLRDLFFRQLSIRGTSVGSSEEFRAVLDLVTKHQIRPVIAQVHPLEDAAAALVHSSDGPSLGKTVFRIERNSH